MVNMDTWKIYGSRNSRVLRDLWHVTNIIDFIMLKRLFIKPKISDIRIC